MSRGDFFLRQFLFVSLLLLKWEYCDFGLKLTCMILKHLWFWSNNEKYTIYTLYSIYTAQKKRETY